VVPTGEVADLILKISVVFFEGNLETVQVILDSGKFLPQTLNYYLPCAVRYQTLPLVEYLLNHPDIDPTIENNMVFFGAVQKGFTSIVQMMLQCRKVHPREGNDMALIIASSEKHPEIVKLLLCDPYINPKEQGNEAMRIAITNNDIDMLKIFLADHRIVPGPYDGALFAQAVRSFSGDFTIIEELIHHPRFDPDLLTNLIPYAVKHGKMDLVSWLKRHPRIFHLAVQAQNAPMVRFLLENEAVDPSARGNEALKTALIAQNFDIIELLLNDQRVLRAFDANHEISLALKHFKGDFRIIDFLLKVIEFLKNNDMIDPKVIQFILPYAVKQGNIELVNWLLGHPMIDPNAAEGYALHLAVSRGDAKMVKILVENPRVDAGAKHNEALLIAICRRDDTIVRTLLSSRKINADDQNGMFLPVSVEIGEHLITDFLRFQVAQVSGDDNLALRLAIRKNDIRMVKIILDHPNVDPNFPFNERASPLFLAVESGVVEIVKAILQHPKFGKYESILSKARNLARNLKHEEISNILTGMRGQSGSFVYPSNKPILPLTQLHHRKVAFSKIRRYVVGDSPLQPQAVLDYIFGKPSRTAAEVSALFGVQLLRIAYDDFLIANPQKSEDTIQREFASFILPHQPIRQRAPATAALVQERKRKPLLLIMKQLHLKARKEKEVKE
jgi:ankyrin repeat protein